MITKAVAIAQQQHGFFFDLFSRDAAALGQRVRNRHCGHKGLVIERCNRQIGVRKRLGQNRAINLAVAQLFQQLDGEVFLQHQGHLRHAGNRLPDQVG